MPSDQPTIIKAPDGTFRVIPPGGNPNNWNVYPVQQGPSVATPDSQMWQKLGMAAPPTAAQTVQSKVPAMTKEPKPSDFGGGIAGAAAYQKAKRIWDQQKALGVSPTPSATASPAPTPPPPPSGDSSPGF